MNTLRRGLATSLRGLAAAALLPGLALLAACDDGEGWVVPGPSTEEIVELPLGEYYLRQGFNAPIAFGQGSADLKLIVVGQLDGASTRVLDLAHPGRSLLRGYGRFAGLHEVHRRSRMVDQHGVHGVRTAFYRKTDDGFHTNVLYQHIARDVRGDLFTTSFAYWDWQSGEEDLIVIDMSAFPTQRGLSRTHRFDEAIVGLTPHSIGSTGPVRTVFLSTDARAPTAGIEGCVLYLFNHIDPERRYLAYFHEDLGLVEVVYEWETAYDFDQTDGAVHSVLPRSGFALAEDPVEDPVERLETRNQYGGEWLGVIEVIRSADEYAEDPEVFREHRMTLAMDSIGQSYSPLTGSYIVRGTYSDDRIDNIEIVGHVVPTHDEIRFINAPSRHSIYLTIDTPERGWGGSGELRIRSFERWLDMGEYLDDPDRGIRNTGGVLFRGETNP